MIVRVARHTDNLDLMIEFYCKYLNFEVLGEFENHNSYDGVFIGKKDLEWYLNQKIHFGMRMDLHHKPLNMT